jgi:hypothetical protein
MKPVTLVAAILLLWCNTATAQRIDRNKFEAIDKYVSDLGPMQGHYLKFIVDTLTHRGTAPDLEKVRALYMWEAHNIDYNTSARRHPKQANTSASTALNERKASHEGYANLFKAMCDLAQVECVVVTGMAKFDPRDIGSLSPKWNKHSWNAVKVDKTWYLLDIPWSAGRTDRKFRFYTKSFTDAWFFTDRDLFALSHYPDKKQWQLLDTPINKSNFTFAPIIGRSAIVNEVYTTQIRGNVRGKADTTKNMIFELGNPSLVKSVAITRRTSEKIPVKYTINGDKMSVDIPFQREGDYAFNMYINDELAYTYLATVGKAKKKPAPRPAPKAKSATTAKKVPVKKGAAVKKGTVAAQTPEEKAANTTTLQPAMDRPMTKKEKNMEAKRAKAEAKKAAAKEKAAAKKQNGNNEPIAEAKAAEAPKENNSAEKPMSKKQKAMAEKKALAEKNAAAKKEREEMLKKKGKN